MFRFRPEVIIIVLAILALSAEVGIVWPYLMHALHQKLTLVALGMVSTAVLVAVAAGLRRRLPNYGGAPPMKDLVRILVPFAAVMLLAIGNIMMLSTMLDQVLEAQTGRLVALQVARAMSLGVIGFALYHAVLIVMSFRRDVEWERRMHPHEYK